MLKYDIFPRHKQNIFFSTDSMGTMLFPMGRMSFQMWRMLFQMGRMLFQMGRMLFQKGRMLFQKGRMLFTDKATYRSDLPSLKNFHTPKFPHTDRPTDRQTDR